MSERGKGIYFVTQEVEIDSPPSSLVQQEPGEYDVENQFWKEPASNPDSGYRSNITVYQGGTVSRSSQAMYCLD
jgi:hypothetical protein